MILEIALGIVLAIIILAALPEILALGMILVCLGIIAAAVYFLFFSRGYDPGLIELWVIVVVCGTVVACAILILPSLMLKGVRRSFGNRVNRLECAAGMSLESMAKTGVIGVCCLLFAGYAVVNLVSHGHGDVAVLAAIIAAVMCLGLVLFVGQEQEKFVPPQPPANPVGTDPVRTRE